MIRERRCLAERELGRSVGRRVERPNLESIQRSRHPSTRLEFRVYSRFISILFQVYFGLRVERSNLENIQCSGRPVARLFRGWSFLPGVPHLQENAPPSDPTVDLCLGS